MHACVIYTGGLHIANDHVFFTINSTVEQGFILAEAV